MTGTKANEEYLMGLLPSDSISSSLPTALLSQDEQQNEQVPLLRQSSESRERSLQYATTNLLSPYIPELDPENPRAQTLRVKKAKRSTMLLIQVCLALIVVVVTLTFITWALASKPPDSQGKGTLFFGNCSTATNLNTAIHAALNILSSLLLGAGNYCMQILVAPNRREINLAHKAGAALEIGVSSVKNLRFIDRKRTILWGLMGLAATILHLFWNSTIFVSLPVVSIPRALVTSDFASSGDNWTISYADAPWSTLNDTWFDLSPVYDLQAEADGFTKLDWRTCLDRYVDPFNATGSVIVVMANLTTAQNAGSSLIDGWISAYDAISGVANWLCTAYAYKSPSKFKGCTKDWSETLVDEWVVGYGPKYTVDHCLISSQADNNQRCGVHYSAPVVWLVCAFTFVEAVAVLCIWIHARKHKGASHGEYEHQEKTMITIGDAISNFLQNPDYTLLQSSTASTTPSPNARAYAGELGAATWEPQPRVSWLKAVSIRTWIISFGFFIATLGVATFLLIQALVHLRSLGIENSSIWGHGLAVNPILLVSPGHGDPNGAIHYLGNVLLANIFQIVISFLYVFYNNILTRQLVADELLRFMPPEGKKPLRVSSPVGMQRSSYFLSLPFRFSIPLNIATILIHWLISQSFFLVQANYFAPGSEGARLPQYDRSSRGYSILGITISIAVGLVLLIALLINSMVRDFTNVPSTLPSALTNSAVIEGLCQRPEGDVDAYLFPIRLGSIIDSYVYNQKSEKECMGRLAFSTDIRLDNPCPGLSYIQPMIGEQQQKKKQ
ncbi:hypothetical protein O1611_g5414 [Lasiodiplodia mahajangana]|uniref:Uncharacterized protein n=1 Tax=Lasiodiplodia mahajangana TaxID=1108764 RepID=A0ACC2JL55_9PEZI|nr:hypothetical protein O1611_g5414 [Lasiodiplodia mahajangana]